MIRLIDADKLISDNISDYAKDDEEIVSRYEINCAPTVEVEPVRHGHWTWYYTSKQELSYGSTEYTPMFMCSECGHRYESYRRYDEPHEEDADYPKYCENCGARMDGKEEK